jgi:hypothetical protein
MLGPKPKFAPAQPIFNPQQYGWSFSANGRSSKAYDNAP